VSRAWLILASDRVSRGERADQTAERLRSALEGAGLVLEGVEAVPDDQAALAEALGRACGRAELVLTSGGTGIAPRDVTPEATRAVIEREIPGLGEAMRAASGGKVPTASLSRALAGTRGRALIVNLPGSPGGAEECLRAILPAVKHGLKLLEGAVRDCATDPTGPLADR